MACGYRQHALFLEEMSDYIISHLQGSSDSQIEFKDHDPPHRNIILGSLAPLDEEKVEDTRSSVKNNSLSIKFQVRNLIDIPISMSFSTYNKIKDENSIPIWQRKDHKKEIILNVADNNRELLADSNGVQYNIQVGCIITEVKDFYQYDISITNNTKNRDGFVYNVRSQLNIKKETIIPYDYSYIYEEEEYSVEPSPLFRTINCCATYSGDAIEINSNSKFIEYKRSPKLSDAGISLSFSELKDDRGVDLLREYSYHLKSYYTHCRKRCSTYNTSQKEQVKHFKNICDKFEDGINLLESEDNVRKAFCLMNEAFEISSDYSYWRLFQIVFIISSLRAVFDPNHDRDVCDVIHVSTGGGKTEAYLGLVIFAALYDKVRGCEDGTSAIIKFPLRMLSIQQLTRVAKVVIIADDLKNRNGIGGAPISLSYFVGDSKEFPNKTISAIEDIKREFSEKGEYPQGKIISKCPFCDSKVELRVVDSSSSIHHVCTNSECNRTFLIYYTDQEVYRYLPSIIISTVDKFSGVSKSRHVKNIFGAKTNICGEHGHISKNDECLVCKSKGSPFLKKSATPSLIIQDELHLIRESFGTIDAHFESFCVELQKSLTGNVPKHIALTATTTGCDYQVNQLYNRASYVFPGKFPDSDSDPFFIDERDGKEHIIHRIIYGIKPNGRDNQYAILISLKYLSKFLWEFNEKIQDKAKDYDCTVEDCEELIEYHNKILTYYGKVSDVHTINHFLDGVVNEKADKRYVVEGHTLLGEKSLDEIGDLIESVQSYKRNDQSGIHCTFSTSIVSHGVDIKEWNVMMFQGIPDNTAEYIQALSRVGRKYPGLVFVWFYPNRVRDLSFYGHFNDYHNMIEHKVEPVSINKWTALSLKETFTSIYNASILNYMSAVLERPLHRRKDVLNMLSESKNRERLLEFIQRVYRSDDDHKGSDFFKGEIPKMVQEWSESIERIDDQGKKFFPLIFDFLASVDKYYTVQSGMRGIQDNVMFKPGNGTYHFLLRGDSNE